VPYFRVGTPRASHATTSPDFPAGTVSYLHAIPAIGSKGKLPDREGPQSLFDDANGTYHGSIVLSAE
jgi:hypothetical protein